jgi:solute carrier family 6 amino acid transporter-like protein 5/7/9/14
MNASYNPFKHNVYRDAVIVSLMDTFTSLFAGFTVFSILGNLAAELNVDVSVVAKSGPGLIFVSYADAISKFDWVPQLFAVIFFLMLFSLGVGSAVSWQMGIITVICDQFPKLSKLLVTSVSCIICFLVGLIYVTPGGQFMLTLVDSFGGNFTIYVLATLEVIGVAWVYGLNNFCRDIEFMLDIKIGWFWRFTWGFFVPIALSVILVYSLVKWENVQHNDTDFPAIAIACGWMLAGVCLALVPIFGIHTIVTRKGNTWMEKLKLSFQPTDDWGPKNSVFKKEWKIYKAKTA